MDQESLTKLIQEKIPAIKNEQECALLAQLSLMIEDLEVVNHWADSPTNPRLLTVTKFLIQKIAWPKIVDLYFEENRKLHVLSSIHKAKEKTIEDNLPFIVALSLVWNEMVPRELTEKQKQRLNEIQNKPYVRSAGTISPF